MCPGAGLALGEGALQGLHKALAQPQQLRPVARTLVAEPARRADVQRWLRAGRIVHRLPAQ